MLYNTARIENLKWMESYLEQELGKMDEEYELEYVLPDDTWVFRKQYIELKLDLIRTQIELILYNKF